MTTHLIEAHLTEGGRASISLTNGLRIYTARTRSWILIRTAVPRPWGDDEYLPAEARVWSTTNDSAKARRWQREIERGGWSMGHGELLLRRRGDVWIEQAAGSTLLSDAASRAMAEEPPRVEMGAADPVGRRRRLQRRAEAQVTR